MEDDEDPQSIAEYVIEDEDPPVRAGMVFTELTANIRYFAMLGKFHEPIVIVDAGADTHIGGKHWLPLSPTEGPSIKKANIIGFDEGATKSGLPVIEAVTKVVLRSGETVLLRAKHLVYNNTSNHTLLSTFQLRDVGFVVDDVAKHHLKNNSGEKGGQCITLEDGKHIDLEVLSALMIFKAELPTMEEYEHSKLPIYDIAQPNWNPSHHYDDATALHVNVDGDMTDIKEDLYYFDPLDKDQASIGHCVDLNFNPYALHETNDTCGDWDNTEPYMSCRVYHSIQGRSSIHLLMLYLL